MDPREVARMLEPHWKARLDAVAREKKLAPSDPAGRLSDAVRALSAAYTDRGGDPRPRSDADLAARLHFFFPRDVPKAGWALRELLLAGALAMPEAAGPAGRPLRILDVGAGLGAMTVGAVRAMEAAGLTGEVEALLVDDDPRALSIASAVAKTRNAQPSRIRLDVKTRAAAVDLRLSGSAGGPFDLVIAGQVLSELDRELSPELREARHVELITRLMKELSPHGSLVVVEPALRERTRHLHAVRDRLLAEGHATVFAPCLHAAACPALLSPKDWCHEDAAIDLPPWLVPIARGAGLRWEGLTLTYLVLRRDGVTYRDALREATGTAIPMRVISGALVTKGKSERILCGELGGKRSARVSRLDRDASDANAAWESLGKGDVVGFDPPLDAAATSPRVARTTVVRSLVGSVVASPSDD